MDLNARHETINPLDKTRMKSLGSKAKKRVLRTDDKDIIHRLKS